MSLPDYVLTEQEDRARRRTVTPSQISPWAYGVSMLNALTTKQCDELRAMGIDPATVDRMAVNVPLTDPFPIDTRAYRRAVQRLTVPIVRTVGQRITVITPKGDRVNVYAGGRLSPPKHAAQRRARGQASSPPRSPEHEHARRDHRPMGFR